MINASLILGVLFALLSVCSANNICSPTDFAGTITFTGGCKEFTQQGSNTLAVYTLRYSVSSACDIMLPIGNKTTGVNEFVAAPGSASISQAQGQAVRYSDTAGSSTSISVLIDPLVVWNWYLGLATVGQYSNNHLFVSSTNVQASCTI